MKRFAILILFGLLHQTIALACVCVNTPLIERTADADFIATAKIITVNPSEDESRRHDIQIEILDLFKGTQTNSLQIYSALGSSCSFYTPEKTSWLIFAKKDANGKLAFGFCSGSKQLNKKLDRKLFPNAENNYKKAIKRKLQLLDYLANENINPINEFNLRTSFSTNCLKNFKGLKVNGKPFALYELTIEKDFTVSDVVVIKGFNNSTLTQDLQDYISSSLKVSKKRKNIEINKKTKLMIALFHYKSNKNYQSFISEYDW